MPQFSSFNKVDMSVCCTYWDKDFLGDVFILAQILSGVPYLVRMFLPQVLLQCKAKPVAGNLFTYS